MPRRRTRFDGPRRADENLAARLAEELTNPHESGQPLIYEQEFPTGKLRVNVIWDDWDRLSLEERTAIILRAYERAEGRGAREKIALASGLTVPEAHAAGMLPFQIIPVLRKSDPVTIMQCREAMVAEGASVLIAPDQPQSRFATLDEAEAAKSRLIRRLPESEPVWAITYEVGQGFGRE